MITANRKMIFSARAVPGQEGRNITVFGRDPSSIVDSLSAVSRRLENEPKANLRNIASMKNAILIDGAMIDSGTVKENVPRKGWKEASNILTVYARQHQNCNPDRVIKVYKQALALNSYNMPARTMLAEFLGSEGRLNEMASQIQKMLNASPKSPGLLASMGRVLYAQGKYQEAAPYFHKAVTGDRNNPRFRIERALNNLELGWFGSVLEDANKLRTLGTKYKKDAEILQSMVMAKEHIKRWAAEKRVPADTLEELADAYNHFRCFYQEISTLEKKIEINPIDFGAKFRLADVYCSTNQSKKAIELLKGAIAQVQSIHSMGDEEELPAFVKDAKESVTTSAYVRLVLAYKGIGMYDEAIEALLKVKETGKDAMNQTAFYGALGQLYLISGKLAEAIETYTKLIGLEPANPENYLSRAMAYTRAGDKEASDADLQKVKEMMAPKQDANGNAVSQQSATLSAQEKFAITGKLSAKGLSSETEQNLLTRMAGSFEFADFIQDLAIKKGTTARHERIAANAAKMVELYTDALGGAKAGDAAPPPAN